MTTEDSRDVVHDSRRILGDITNNNGKRALNFVSSNETGQRNAEATVENSKFKRPLCGGTENSISRKGRPFCTQETNEGVADLKGKGLVFQNFKRPIRYIPPGSLSATAQKNALLNVQRFANSKDMYNLQLLSSAAGGNSNVGLERVRPSNTSLGSIPDMRNASGNSVLESEEETEDDSETDSSDLMGHASEIVKKQGISSTLSDSSTEFMVSEGTKIDDSGVATGHLFDNPFPFVHSRPTESLGSEMTGMERLPNLHATSTGAGDDFEGTMDSCKTCSCTFCLKAAYICADLHYQDTRGLLTALKKSRRYARSLEGKTYSHDQTAKFAGDNTKLSIDSEYDLMQRCRSLFLHMEDALAHETTKLQSKLLRLKELREKCKKDLDMVNVVIPDKLQ